MQHHFDTQLARLYGIEEAIFINNFQFWITKNRANSKHQYDGRTWTFNSVEAFSKLFPYMTTGKIRRTLESLVKQEIVLTGNYNCTAYDRTLWYAFKDEALFLDRETTTFVFIDEANKIDEMHLSKTANGNGESSAPIPNNKPDKKQGEIFTQENPVPDEATIKKAEEELKKRTKEAAATVHDKDPFMKLYVDAWLKVNQEKSNFTPAITSRECRHLKNIAAELRRRCLAINWHWTEELAAESLQKFFEAAYKKDDWLRRNFSLSNIETQMNAIFKILLNVRETTTETRTGTGGKASGTISFFERISKEFGSE